MRPVRLQVGFITEGTRQHLKRVTRWRAFGN